MSSSQLGLHSECQASLSYIVRFCLKKKKKRRADNWKQSKSDRRGESVEIKNILLCIIAIYKKGFLVGGIFNCLIYQPGKE
jgi:hypothetical protein